MNERSLYLANGSSVELNNCLEEARIATAHGNGEARAVIDRAVADGLFVVVCEATAYCRSTDAICGAHLSMLGAYGSRHAADDVVAGYYLHNEDRDETYYVLPRLPKPEPAPRSAGVQAYIDGKPFDDCPF